jgi:hypothetical protein
MNALHYKKGYAAKSCTQNIAPNRILQSTKYDSYKEDVKPIPSSPFFISTRASTRLPKHINIDVKNCRQHQHHLQTSTSPLTTTTYHASQALSVVRPYHPPSHLRRFPPPYRKTLARPRHTGHVGIQKPTRHHRGAYRDRAAPRPLSTFYRLCRAYLQRPRGRCGALRRWLRGRAQEEYC